MVARLAEPGLARDRVLAAGVRMLDLGVFRPGGEEYAPGDDDEDGTFGLATLRREHVTVKRGAVMFAYTAKGGIPRALALRDPLLHKMVSSLLRRRGGGDDLLAYRTGARSGTTCAPRTSTRRSRSWRARVHLQGPAHLERDGARRGDAGRRGGPGRGADGRSARASG